MKKYLLFTPGPVNVAQNVRAAICKQDICHREDDFEYLLESIEDKLLRLFNIERKANYRAIVITGSGTAANESILSSVVGNKNILILSNGEFGERLYKISKPYNKNTFLLDFGWGKRLDLQIIEDYLTNHKVDVVAMVHHETSSGMLNPLEEIGAISKAQGALFVVDAVSSVGAEIIDMEKNHIAFCSGSSSKAIGSYAGISFVIGKVQEFETLKDHPSKSTYLNLYTHYHFSKTRSQTPNTPAVNLFFALEQALSNLLSEGILNRYAHIQKKADILRQGMLDLSLKFVIKQSEMCSVLTSIYIPSNTRVDILRKKLRENSIIIYEGKGCYKDRVFQVGNIGELSLPDIDLFLTSLREILFTEEPVQQTNIYPIKNHHQRFTPANTSLSQPYPSSIDRL